MSNACLVYFGQSPPLEDIDLYAVSLRTVPPDTPGQEVVCTWATVSCVNATATQTPANLRPASARYETPVHLFCFQTTVKVK